MRVFTIAMLALGLALVSGTTILAATEVDVQVSPHTLLIGATQGDITVHVDFPYDPAITVDVSVDGAVLADLPYSTFADDCGDLVVRFPEGPVKEAVSGWTAEIGIDSEQFSGSDTVNVRTFRGKGR